MSTQTFITVSSRNRKSGTTTNFRSQIQRVFLGKEKHTIKLITASIPLTYYSINNTNNQVVIDGTTYSLTPSKYSSSSFATELRRIFAIHNVADTSDIAVNTATGKLNITPSANYTLNTSSIAFTALSPMGLTATDKTLIEDTLFVGENLVNLIEIDAFYIRLPGLIRGSFADFSDLPNDFVTVVDIVDNHLDFTIAKYLPNQSPQLELAVGTINDITVLVMDQQNREVDLNGAETSFSFVIERAM